MFLDENLQPRIKELGKIKPKLDDDDIDLIKIGDELESMSKKICVKSNSYNDQANRKLLTREASTANQSIIQTDYIDDTTEPKKVLMRMYIV